MRRPEFDSPWVHQSLRFLGLQEYALNSSFFREQAVPSHIYCMEVGMNALYGLSAASKHFQFSWHEGRVSFSCIVFLEAFSEAEKRRLILDGIAGIENLDEDQKDPDDCVDCLIHDAKAMLAETEWEEPRIPIVMYAHQEMCFSCVCHYAQCIRRKIDEGAKFPYEIIDVPYALFQAIENTVRTQSYLQPLSLN